MEGEMEGAETEQAESVPSVALWLFSTILITETLLSLGGPLETQVP